MNDEIDLPTLQSLTIGSWSLQGDYRDNRKTISREPYNYKNTLRMRSNNEWDNDLNRSSFIDWDERRLEQFHVYRISDTGEYENGNDWRTDIPILSSSGLSFTGDSFNCTYSLHSSSTPLISLITRFPLYQCAHHVYFQLCSVRCIYFGSTECYRIPSCKQLFQW